jgi:hypothetical protein
MKENKTKYAKSIEIKRTQLKSKKKEGNRLKQFKSVEIKQSQVKAVEPKQHQVKTNDIN